MSKRLISTCHILYNSKEYVPGDELPENATLVDEWLKNGSAVFENENSTKTPKTALASYQAGAVGINVENAESDITLVGKIPITQRREKFTSKYKSQKRKISSE